MKRQSPLYFLFVVTASIFFAEAVVMLFLSAFPGFSTIKSMIVDSSMLVIIVSPVLYIFLFRPLVLHISERKEAEEDLKEKTQKLEAAYTDMEKMVHIIEKSANELGQKNIELEVARDMAEAGSRAKSEFLANMSHELRTPLNSVIGFSDVMIDGMAGPMTNEQKGFIKDINESGKALLSIIDDILDFSRLDTTGIELEYSEADMKDLIEENLARFRETIGRRDLRLNVDIAGDIGRADLDKNRIGQVLLNLLTNAAKFTPDRGSVNVSARRVGSAELGVGNAEKERIYSELITQNSEADRDFIEISVEDTGIGISGDDLKRLFTPFQQLERHLTKKHGGIGIGLIICKRIIDLHKGRICAESEQGKGSRFAFRIPARQVRQEEVNA